MKPRQLILALLALAALIGLGWLTLREPTLERSTAELRAPPPATGEDPRTIEKMEEEVRTAVEVQAPIDSAAEEPAKVAPADTSWLVRTEPGVLEVEVWLGKERLPGAEVCAFPVAIGKPSDPVDFDANPNVLRSTTGADGRARFSPLPHDGEYSIRVLHGEQRAFLETYPLDKSQTFHRIVIRFGSGGIEGRVFRDDRSPWPEQRVFVRAKDTSESHGFWIQSKTGVDGTFRFAGIPKSTVDVVVPNANDRSARVRVEEGEWKHIDFGTDQPTVLWTGRLRSETGAPLEVATLIHLQELEHGNFEYFRTRADGSFALEFVPGHYRATNRFFSNQLDIDEFRLEGAAVEHDIVLRGALVRGSVTYIGTSPDKAGPARSVQVRLHDRGNPHVSGIASRTGDRFTFLGVPPGKYRITTDPSVLVGADAEGGIPIDIGSDPSTVDFDLTIQDP